MDSLNNSKDPIIASHTFSKKVYEHDRGANDEIIKAIGEKRGYFGVLTICGFLSGINLKIFIVY